MKYSNISQTELDGLLIGITDLYRLYNPSAIPSDEPPSESDSYIRFSLSGPSNRLNEPQKSFDVNYSAEKTKKQNEIRKIQENENKQLQSSKYKKLDVIEDSKDTDSRKTLKEIRAKGYSAFDHLSLYIDNILEKKHSKNLNYQTDIQLGPTFSELLVNYISEKGLNNADVYKAAQIDRRHFSKIISNTLYNPTRDTVFSLIIALKLNMEEAEDLMATAGYAFSKSSKRDVVLEYFIRTQNYDINVINEVLNQLQLDILKS